MAVTNYNGIITPTNSDDYDPTGDMGIMARSTNVPIAVDNQAERDGLAAAYGGSLPIGTVVLRKDQSMFIEKWDGSAWRTDGHSEWTKNGQSVPQNTVWGVGALTIDAGKTTDTAFVTHPASDVLQFRDAGVYTVTFTAKATAILSTRAFLQFVAAGDTNHIRVPITGEDRGLVTFPNWRASAGQQLVFSVYHESGAARTMDFRICVTRTG